MQHAVMRIRCCPQNASEMVIFMYRDSGKKIDYHAMKKYSCQLF